ncbi:MAG: 1-acyl-sn-glycerol-3-phosphate acyltransferase [Clostridia bacterium]|nr:1-acyl-sn-glycerol-3-phosphate acyltransferase [Clostridia bacterium]
MQIIRRRRGRHGFAGWKNRALAWLLTPLFGCRCRIPEHIAALEEPVVFVSNHYEIFGPLSMAVSLPLRFRFWSHSIILEPTKHVERMAADVKRVIPVLTLGGARRFLRWITPVWERAIRHFGAIPVSRADATQQRGVLRRSVEYMAAGDHIVLFPETGEPRYSDGSVTEFHRSFALIGEYYLRRTGRMAAFCPVYIDKRRRRISFGEVVRYGDGAAIDECERVSQELRARILAMAEAAHPGITRAETEQNA